MSDERDTRVEELRAGDQVRYLGEWFDVVKVTLGIGRFPDRSISPLERKPRNGGMVDAPYVALSIDDPGPDGRPRVVYWLRGSFVAAECNPRAEAS